MPLHMLIRAGVVTMLLSGLIQPAAADGEPITVEGRIRELGTKEAVVGAVILDGTRALIGEADVSGRFRVAVPRSTTQLIFRAPGFKERTLPVPDPSRRLKVSMRRVEFKAAEVVVRGRRQRSESSRTQLTQREISRIPGTGGDALRAIQALPGVASPSDFSGQLAVRGGDPDDNLYFLDNIPWPVPYHFGGLLSTVHPDLLATVDLHAGGFGPRWGNATGAIIDATLRPGRHDRFHGNTDINLATADVLFEGPLGFGKSSWTLAGRRSYFDFLLNQVGDTEFTAFPRFWDLGGSLNLPLSTNDRLRFIAMSTDDLLGLVITDEDTQETEFTGAFRFRNRYLTTGASWRNTALENFDSNLTVYWYKVNLGVAFGEGFNVDVFPRIAGIKEEAEWDAGSLAGMPHRLGFGAGLETIDFNIRGYFHRRISGKGSGAITLGDPVQITVTDHDLRGYAYVQDRISLLSTVALTAGGRYDRSRTVGRNELTPRTNLEWEVTPRTTVNAAWGLYAQDPSLLELHPDYGNPDLRPMLTQHLVLGVERELAPGVVGRLEAYDKDMRRVVVDVPDIRIFSNEGTGFARGIELLLRYDRGERFFGWLSYARSISRRKTGPGQPWRNHEYDQPDIGTLVASYGIIPSCTIGTKVRYSSGSLITPLEGRFLDSAGLWHPIYGEPFSRRLDPYIRIDARISYDWLFAGWKLTLYIETLNVFNRANPAGVTANVDLSETIEINNLPRLYYFGLGIEF